MRIFFSFFVLSLCFSLSLSCKKTPPDPALGQELLSALERGDESAARELIGRGADINARQAGTGYTPYVVAAKKCLTDPVRLLDKKGADMAVEVSSGSPVDRSAFMNAAMAGCLDTIRYFVEEKKMDINTRHHVWNETILHKAVQGRDLTLARYAIERGVDLNITDNNKRTALDLAKELGVVDITMLIENARK
ncbi:MAG TPA: ankyrin repeat domain-containing protein [bacterium]|nr:ankyrin repeat domain-containing protein [bacterium]